MKVMKDGKANPPDIEDMQRRANAGERFALAQLYGNAAAWIKHGECPPEPQAAWLAEQLDKLKRAIWKSARDPKDPKGFEAEIVRAVGVRRAKAGRPKKIERRTAR
jgi:hypothetical protein